MYITFKNEWEVKTENMVRDVAIAIVNHLSSIVAEQIPQFNEMFPFNNRYNAEMFGGENWFGFTIKFLNNVGIPSIGKIEDQNTIELLERVYNNHKPYPSFTTLQKLLGAEYFNFYNFTYIGKYENSKLSWTHIQTVLIDWLNQVILPVIYERNRARVLSAIPTPPSYDSSKILSNTFILESEEAVNQGTCFHIKGVGLITCEHAIQNQTNIFTSNNFQTHFPVQVEKSNQELDLAIIKAEGFALNDGLELGSADNLQLTDHIAVIGYPNYRWGDTGILSPGLVIGFRTVSGVRRILTNIPIIAGNSGGPVVDKESKVIGVAVTGADRMEDADKTENHGIIPIEMLNFLK